MFDTVLRILLDSHPHFKNNSNPSKNVFIPATGLALEHGLGCSISKPPSVRIGFRTAPSVTVAMSHRRREGGPGETQTLSWLQNERKVVRSKQSRCRQPVPLAGVRAGSWVMAWRGGGVRRSGDVSAVSCCEASK